MLSWVFKADMLFKMFTFAEYLVTGQYCMGKIKVSSNRPVISAEMFILYLILTLLSTDTDDVFTLSCILIIATLSVVHLQQISSNVIIKQRLWKYTFSYLFFETDIRTRCLCWITWSFIIRSRHGRSKSFPFLTDWQQEHVNTAQIRHFS